MTAVQVSWFDQIPHVVHLQFPDEWTLEDFVHASEQARLLIAKSNRRVDLLIDLRNNDNSPANSIAMFNSLFSLQPGKIGMMLFITHSAFQRALVTVIQRINAPLKRKVLLISTTAEILALLGGQDS